MVLAVKPKAEVDLHRQYLKEEAERFQVSNTASARAKKLKEEFKGVGGLSAFEDTEN